MNYRCFGFYDIKYLVKNNDIGQIRAQILDAVVNHNTHNKIKKTTIIITVVCMMPEFIGQT